MQILTHESHGKLDQAIGKLLEAYSAGSVNKQDFVLNVMHMVAAVDVRNHAEIETFMKHPLLRLPELFEKKRRAARANLNS